MSSFDIRDVVRRSRPLRPWAEGDCIPWNDRDFSVRMLREHLSQEHDLASRRSEIVDAHVQWLHSEVLHGPDHVLDLACGPGLYLHGLARLGHTGSGVDFAPASIEYARSVASREGLRLRFELADLRDARLGEGFGLATLLSGQLHVFRRADAARLLSKARAALRPAGHLVLEVHSFDAVRGDAEYRATWRTSERGLFSDRPHLTLHEQSWCEEERCKVERWYVVDVETGRVVRHAQTTIAYETAELLSMLREAGFRDVHSLPSLPATPEEQGLFVLTAQNPAGPS